MNLRARARSVQKALVVGGTVATAALCSAGMAFAAATPALPEGAFAAPYPGGYFVSDGPDGPGGQPFGVGDLTGVYGSNTGQPGEPGQFQGHDTFTVYNADHEEIGTFDALVGYNYESYNPHFQMLVTDVHPVGDATVGTGEGQLPAVGSVFDYGHSMTGPAWTYASLAGYDVHDPDATVSGDVVHSNDPTFDASAHVDVHQLGVGDMKLPGGGYLMADHDSPETYTGISNTAPFASTVQGTQIYDVFDAAGHQVGQVNAITISTADLAGGHSQEVFVTDVISGTPGAADGDVPTVGSVINYLNYFGLGNSVYYDLHGTGADGANQMGVLWNMLGMPFTTATSFDAVKGFTDGTPTFQEIPFLNGMTITPTGGEIGYTPSDDGNYYTGINGIPNGGVSGNNTDVQSFQHFDITGAKGADPTPFSAYVTDYTNGSVTDQTMLIHDIAAGNGLGLQDGSTIEYADHGWFSTLEVNTDPTGLGDGTNEVTQMLSIPLLGGAWTEVDPSSDFLLSLAGITF